MSQKNSPKVVKISLQQKPAPRKSKMKFQVTKKLFPKSPPNKKQQKTSPPKRNVPSSPSKLKQSMFIVETQRNSPEQSNQKAQHVAFNQFSFSQEKQEEIHKIKGQGYEILWKDNIKASDSKVVKINFYHLNSAMKIFQLCQKDTEHQFLRLEDLSREFQKNLLKHLKSIYGHRNEHLITKKYNEFKQTLKTVFYRKRQQSLKDLIYFMLECQISDQIVKMMVQFYPEQISTF